MVPHAVLFKTQVHLFFNYLRLILQCLNFDLGIAIYIYLAFPFGIYFKLLAGRQVDIWGINCIQLGINRF
ncbi:hypothetical protein VC82_1727 [Flagellimonas lutaonensis]|uniref:Uncharacterized protein n=1 Tax=Flagellimonas lutaonensis TaxID=516051 RepID=A0A0D5YU02_9FLAO|nr:hypothetical protein VC82_1727 [Allomuricauda lutaonensis]